MELAREEHPLKWAVYLGVSWTWCIGMFLPVLLVRDLGTWAWWAFAIPNVVGAGAMGWVMRNTPMQSLKLQTDHRHACVAFSVVTVTFHIFFLFWMVERLLEARFFSFVVPLVLVMIGIVTHRRWGLWAASFSALAISIIAWIWIWDHLDYGISASGVRGGLKEVSMLAPVFVLGFALCPYLDLTFHRARLYTSVTGGKRAFAAGFGVFFFAMIVFTLGYAPLLSPIVQMPNANRLIRSVAIALGLHMAFQSIVTISFHVLEIWAELKTIVIGGIVGILMLIVLVITKQLVLHEQWFEMTIGEVMYRHFMGFYGFVFPAYVWVCVFNSRGTERQRLIVFAGSVLVALPMGFMAFVLNRFVWTLPAVGVIVVAPFLLRRGAAVDRINVGVDHAGTGSHD